MKEFVLATANPDKAEEIKDILGDSVRLISRPPELGDVEETGSTLLENARLKALSVARETGRPAVADDTGLEVEALGGAPGVYSARYAGERASYQDNVAKLLRELADYAEPRRARFRTVAVVVWPDRSELVAEGSVPGVIALAPRGTGGFGYDPVFVPNDGDGRTFAEMDAREKHRISHRGAAFRSLRELLSLDKGRRTDTSCDPGTGGL
jgi:XTP/dITP diphosphohydrolase